jgi:glycosyltransferase involved in cell wall biosynthesis
MQKISIVIPIHNEERTLNAILDRVTDADTLSLQKEIILVDDGSTDRTKEILRGLEDNYKIIYHQTNLGKGAALRSGFSQASGDIIIVQDADLEYDPKDYSNLLRPILQDGCSVVYGNRDHKGNPSIYKLNYLGNKLISFLISKLYKTNLHDAYCCYKVFRSEVLKSLQLTQNGFGLDGEITMKTLKANHKIYEVPISYYPRTIEEGKKINWKHGVEAIWLILKYKFFD